MEGLGADEVIGSTATDFAEAVCDVDVVLGTLGGDTAQRSLAVLRQGGHLVTAVADADTALIADAAAGVRFSGIGVARTRSACAAWSSSSNAGSCGCTSERPSRSSGSPTRTGCWAPGTCGASSC